MLAEPKLPADEMPSFCSASNEFFLNTYIYS